MGVQFSLSDTAIFKPKSREQLAFADRVRALAAEAMLEHAGMRDEGGLSLGEAIKIDRDQLTGTGPRPRAPATAAFA